MAKITGIGRLGSYEYGVRFVVCSNDEVMGQQTDHPSEIDREQAFRFAKAAGDAITDAGFDYRLERSFQKYNGGGAGRLVEAHIYRSYVVGEPECWRYVLPADRAGIPAKWLARVEAITDSAEQAMREAIGHELRAS